MLVNASTSIASTGRLELTYWDRDGIHGTWQLPPMASIETTNGFVWGAVWDSFVALNLSCQGCAEGPYSLEGSYSGATMAGPWYYCGFVCVRVGNYTARRICP